MPKKPKVNEAAPTVEAQPSHRGTEAQGEGAVGVVEQAEATPKKPLRRQAVEKAAQTDAAPKKKLRRRAEPEAPYQGPDLLFDATSVQMIPLTAVNLEDETFQIRFSSQPDSSLLDSVRSIGVQTPIVVRLHPEKEGEYQVVCGFRRTTAATQAGCETVPAQVRILSDEEAQIIAFTENEFRKTLSNLDRARAMAKFRKSGKTTAEIGSLFRMGRRQVQIVEGLLRYPPELQRAVDDEKLSLTSALILCQAKRKHGEAFKLSQWIEEAGSTENVEGLREAMRKAFPQNRTANESFQMVGNTVILTMNKLRQAKPEQKEAAITEVERLLAELEGVLAELKGGRVEASEVVS